MRHHMLMIRALAWLAMALPLAGCLSDGGGFNLASYGVPADRPARALDARVLGAVGDGITDDTESLNCSIGLASLAGAALFIPSGTYKVTAPLAIPCAGGLRIYGEGKTSTVIKACGTFASLLTIGDSSAQAIRGCIQDVQFNALDATVQYGIYGTRVEEHDFVRVACFGFRTAGFSIGFGYVNNYLQCEASYCWGNGFETNSVYGTGGNNSISYSQCMALANDGWGIKASHGYHISITSCTIEANDKGGIYLNNFPASNIQAYFEGNAAVGQTFTTPAVTVKADILLNGSATDTELNPDYPCRAASITGCYTYPLSTSNAFVWNGGAVDASVRECYTGQPGYVPCVTQHSNIFYRGAAVAIQNCSSFTTQSAEVTP